MRIATWNVERLKHRRELPQMAEICNKVSADIFVLTETDSALDLDFKACVRTSPPIDGAVKYRGTEYRVAIFTNYEVVKQHETFNSHRAVCTELLTEYGKLLVYGVVIGIYGNRHLSFSEDLPRILNDVERLAGDGTSLCVCGDYNISFSDNYYFTKAGRDSLEEVLATNNLELLTRNQPECIDHIALSRGFLGNMAVTLEEWNHDKKLSDHKGISVEVLR